VLYIAGAVFNLLCDQRDTLVMEKIEQYFGTKANEVTIPISIP